MNEWVVVTVIVTLVGFAVTIVKPIARLTEIIAKLEVTVDRLDKSVAADKKETHESFVKIWEHNEEQDEKISDHETRLRLLEEE